MLNNQYYECNKKIFCDENFFQKILKLKKGTILKVKEKNEYHKKINKGHYVMLIHAFSPNSEIEDYRGKYLKNAGLNEVNSRFLELSKDVTIDWDKIKQKIAEDKKMEMTKN